VGRGEKFGFKKENKFFIKKHAVKGNGTKDKTFQREKTQMISRFEFQTQR
jgi:hypothetical protein